MSRSGARPGLELFITRLGLRAHSGANDLVPLLPASLRKPDKAIRIALGERHAEKHAMRKTLSGGFWIVSEVAQDAATARAAEEAAATKVAEQAAAARVAEEASATKVAEEAAAAKSEEVTAAKVAEEAITTKAVSEGIVICYVTEANKPKGHVIQAGMWTIETFKAKETAANRAYEDLARERERTGRDSRPCDILLQAQMIQEVMMKLDMGDAVGLENY